MIAVEERSCERAWLAVAEHLASCSGHVDYNIVVEVAQPAIHDQYDGRVYELVDRFLRDHKANPVSTVADTIFPAAQYLESGSRGVYEVYPEEVYPEILGSREWGRYAYRLVHWPQDAAHGQAINPLKDLVDKMRNQLAKRGPKRACYEISLTDSAIDLPLYDPVTDRAGIMGGPCLSHVSFKVAPPSALNLTAIYRSHYYVARALGK